MSLKTKTLIDKFSTADSGRKVFISKVTCPLGELIALADCDSVYLIQFNDSKTLEKKVEQVCTELKCKLLEGRNKMIDQLQDELDQYFDGKLKDFTVPIHSFGSDFHKEVWTQLQKIPFGTTKSYSEHAQSLGRAREHARAVGTACGANPHVIVVPCHRIVAQGGKGGYSAGNERKEWLLGHEEKFLKI